MRNIDELTLEETSFEIFEKIINSKKEPTKSILEWVKSDIKNCFYSYESNKSDLFPIMKKWYTDDTKDALIHTYEGDTVYTKQIKKNIKKIGNRKCPYCNIEPSVQVEHYIPKDDFPEFAFLINNLIPSCSTCNQKKWTKWRDDKTRLFLNAYYDDITSSNEQFLFTTLWLEWNIPCSKFTINTAHLNINPILTEILKKHVDKLNLLNRYNEEIDYIFWELISNIQEIKAEWKISIEELKNIINHKWVWVIYGKNYRENILYNEICNNDEILKYLLQ